MIGRNSEIKLLTERAQSKRAELVIIYGRRRIGKSTLIKDFSNKYPHLLFEGIENQDTYFQLEHFKRQLQSQIHDPLLQRVQFRHWEDAFDYLTRHLQNSRERFLVSFDEFQWMAAGQSKLVALIKYYWDNFWKELRLMLILCGSIASFMVKKVIKSQALYGRFTLELQVKKLTLIDIQDFFPKSKSKNEILRYTLIFGGVPKYLEEINSKLSLDQNLKELFFKENALFRDEFDKIFKVHFREPKNYYRIIQILKKDTLNLNEISNKLKMKSSGGVKNYIENLELAGFVRSVHSYFHPKSKYPRYKVSDEFLLFYFHFIDPQRKIYESDNAINYFKNDLAKNLDVWLGFAFENYVINNAMYFAEKMGFSERVKSYGPYYGKKEKVQVDLIYARSDKTITLCEMKFHTRPISTEIIPEINRKIEKLPLKPSESLHKVLIAPNGVSQALLDCEYFEEILTMKDIF